MTFEMSISCLSHISMLKALGKDWSIKAVVLSESCIDYCDIVVAVVVMVWCCRKDINQFCRRKPKVQHYIGCLGVGIGVFAKRVAKIQRLDVTKSLS